MSDQNHEDSDSSDSELEIFAIFDDDDKADDTGAEASDEREDTDCEADRGDSEDIFNDLPPRKPLMTLRQRRLSRSLEANTLKLNIDCTRAHKNWMLALRKAKLVNDPWAEFNILKIKEEKCIRHRYHPHKKVWVQDDVKVKMETQVRFVMVYLTSLLLFLI